MGKIFSTILNLIEVCIVRIILITISKLIQMPLCGSVPIEYIRLFGSLIYI